MFYKLFLIIILTFLAAPGMAGEKRYRVEIVILSHLQHEAVPSEAESLRDFSDSLDFLKAEDEDEEDEETKEDDAGAAIPVPEPGNNKPGETKTAPGKQTDDELLLDEDLPLEPCADVIAVEDMSDVMRETWRRLRLSAPFRPEQYLAWEQSADEPFPSLRIHDLEVILMDDPYADLRETDETESKEEDEDRPVVFSDQGNILPGDAIEETAEEPELPDPTLFYRIDGTIMLRRSRFLHLDVDMELRQAAFDEQLPAPALVLSDESETGEPELAVPTSFLIHNLKQSRQVKSKRMEYFDSPVLGVLAWITPFELEDEAESLPD